MVERKHHHHQTGGVRQSPPVLNQETTLGSHRLRTATLIHTPGVEVTPVVEVTLVLETPILEDIPDKTLLEDTQLVEVTLTNREERITQTKTLEGVIPELVAILTNREEGIIQTKTLPGVIPELVATLTNLGEAITQTKTLQGVIQQRAATPTNLGEAVIQEGIQQLVDIRLLGATLTQDGAVVVIQSEEGALGRAGVLRALTLEDILAVEQEATQTGIPTIRSSVLAMVQGAMEAMAWVVHLLPVQQ